MVVGRQGIKYIYLTTFSHADSGGFEKPPLQKHKRSRTICLQKERWYVIARNYESTFGFVNADRLVLAIRVPTG
jgi:hypothetical protein